MRRGLAVAVRTAGAIMVAGALGAYARYALDGFVSRRVGGAFPWGTFVVNVSGAFVLGLVITVLSAKSALDPALRTSITVGFLGAYTTFSTLMYETVRLLENGDHGVAAANALGSLVAGMAAVAAGMAVGRALS